MPRSCSSASHAPSCSRSGPSGRACTCGSSRSRPGKRRSSSTPSTRGGILSPELRGRVTEVAQGNPLYAEQLVAMLAEEARAAAELVSLPPTIQALLAARLDRLDPGRAGGASAGSGRRQGVLARRRGRPRRRGRGPRGDAARPRTPRARRAGRLEHSRPGRLPVPARPDPGCGLRRDPQANACRPPRALRRLARAPRHAGGAPRLPPRAGLPLSRRARSARRPRAVARRAGGRAAHGRRPAGAWRATTCRPRSTCSSAGVALLPRTSGSRGYALLELAIALMRSGSFPAAEGALEEALDSRPFRRRSPARAAHADRARVLPDLHERGNAGGGDHAHRRGGDSGPRGARRRRRRREGVAPPERAAGRGVPLGRARGRTRTRARARPACRRHSRGGPRRGGR